MSYGFEAYDALNKKIVDSNLPVFALERIITSTGVGKFFTYSDQSGYFPWDPANPLRLAYLSAEFTAFPLASFGSPPGAYWHDLASFFTNDPSAQSAILAFSIPVNGFAFYYSSEKRVFTSRTQPTLQIAVLKPVSSLGIGTSTYGAAVYNASGQLTWSTNWSAIRIQKPIGNVTIEQSSWFALSGNRIRRIDSLYNGSIKKGYSGVVGVLRTGLTTIQTKYQPLFSSAGGQSTTLFNNWDNFGADGQDTKGFVLYDIAI